jgi:Ca-activated chloride channel homolog
MRRSPWSWVPLAAAVAGTAGVSAQQTFRARVDLVHLPVVVTDHDGQVIRGLRAGDFQVLDDGQPQKISYFSEGQTGEKLPLHLGLMLDGSESMDRDISAAENAACRFVDRLTEAVDVTYVDFDTTIHLGYFTPDNYLQLFARIRDRQAGGGTSLYDALGVYLSRALGRPGQHVLLVYTDGGDSTSSMNFGRLEDLERLGDVMIYAIGYLQNQSSADRLPQQLRIQQIAHETGGRAFFPESPREIDAVYTDILTELASRYTLGYVPRAAGDDGKFHKIEVRLLRDDLQDAKVRTRSGYLAPSGDAR